MGFFNGVKNWVMPAETEDNGADLENIVAKQYSGERVKIRIETPRDFIEAPKLLADLRENSCLLVNLNSADGNNRRRIYDFLDGARTFAGGTVAEVANETFMFSLQNGNVEKKFTGQKSAFTFDELKKKHNL
ncbi:MAG: cell division protein SepF [Negativicutes bacterium]|jgi:FtsZ-interacting cell division protein YlmF